MSHSPKLGKIIINPILKHRLRIAVVLWSVECRQPRRMDQIDSWGKIVCVCSYVLPLLLLLLLLGGADKYLARPGRKQTTGTKLGISSTYSLRRSIHFLCRCSNFCKPLKNIQNIVRPTSSTRQQWPRRKKNGPNPLTWDAHLLSYWFSGNPAVIQD